MRQKTIPATGLLLLALLFGAFGGATALFALSPLQADRSESEMSEGPVGSAFTYQGRLDDGGGPANGMYDFEFTLYDAPSGGTALGTNTIEDIIVTDGLFTVMLDFGNNVFDGNARYLRLGVRPGQNTGPYVILNPRQPLTPAPYALYATTAPWNGLIGIPPDIADGDDDTTYSAGFGLGLNGTQFEVDSGLVQLRVGDICMPGQAIQAINQDGTVICETDDDTTYSAGFGLGLNGTQFEVDSGVTQLRVGNSCMPGSAIQVINQDGTIICETDDDTTYNAGFGLDLNGTQFNVVTGTVQQRVSGNCAVGQAIQSIGADGSVTCEDVTHPFFSKPDYAITSLDGGGGSYSEITVGSDGLGLISYIGSEGLAVAHCDNLACTSAITTTLDSSIDAFESAITVGADGLGLISYYDSFEGLRVAHCDNLACTSATINTVETMNSFWLIGQVTGITTGADGLGLISYVHNENLNVAHCDNVLCTSVITSTLDSGGPLGVGRYNAITIGVDGLGLISYGDADNDDLKVAHCLDLACTSASTTIVASAGFSNLDTAITIGTDGRPLVSYVDGTTNTVKVAHCENLDCSVATITTVDITNFVGAKPSVTIGADGLGLISYTDGTTGDLKLAHCNNLDCTLLTITTLDYTFDFSYNSITVGADGLSLVSYYDYANDELRVARTVIGHGIRNR